jgi:hypothetical protein
VVIDRGVGFSFSPGAPAGKSGSSTTGVGGAAIAGVRSTGRNGAASTSKSALSPAIDAKPKPSVSANSGSFSRWSVSAIGDSDGPEGEGWRGDRERPDSTATGWGAVRSNKRCR